MFEARIAFGVDTRAAQCYKTPKASPLVVSLLAHLNQRVRPQTCLAGQGCMAAEGLPSNTPPHPGR
jgi:hypothetical protein